MSKLKDLKGMKFGKLTVLNQGPYKTTGRNRVTWDCMCECGNKHNVSASNLKGGNVKTCGCGFKLPKGEASFNRVLNHYKQNSKRRGYSFDINKSDFRNMIVSNCYYCGQEPSMVQKPAKGNNGGFIYNGIDRIDNDLGYSVANCVTCCNICNKAKGTMTKQEFFNWIEKVYGMISEVNRGI